MPDLDLEPPLCTAAHIANSVRILVKSISVPEGKRSAFLRIPDQLIGVQRRWRGDCGESDRDRQAQNWAEVFRSAAEARGFLPPQQRPDVTVSSGMGLQEEGTALESLPLHYP
jgi:hypothetical protein